MTSSTLPQTVDVLLVGGGPISLTATYILAKAGISVLAIEQHDKSEQALYGRACMLYARSLELLSLIGVYSRIADVGFVVRNATTFKDGKRVPARGWSFVQNAIKGKTYFDYSFSIRQKYIEDALRDAIAEFDPAAVQSPAKLLDFCVGDSQEYPIAATVQFRSEKATVHCKYLIGADGGRSSVRTLSNISFPGTLSTNKWVRLDAIVRTNMPESRRVGVSIESRHHGNVLWTPTDNGRTRIGFVCPDALYGEHGENVTAETVMEEARKAVEPFSLEFVKLDWWTVYQIGQRVAETFKKGRVFLAGDAAHTHSSGAAQGLNTGLHDATNLAWKLAGVLKGWFDEEILDTYNSERRASALHLIELDRDIASLISGKIPAHYNPPPDADVNAYLERVFNMNSAFSVGLGVSYQENMLNRPNSAPQTHLIGARAPDALVFELGSFVPRRLHEFMPYQGRFWIMIWAGELQVLQDAVQLSAASQRKYNALREHIASPRSFAHTRAPAFSYLTIVRGTDAMQTSEVLGAEPFGRTVYDHTGEAFDRYDVNADEGAIIVVRPDGIVSLRVPLARPEELDVYFARILRPCEQQVKDVEQSTQGIGEISLEGRKEITKLSE
ncbi:uncharacterized protein LAESUDRAFT_732313 [Laetiporus sulphureus 93-53]|uniref:FAD-binding domain-containing protein n=1 Tax=Laetiporus sulphureus 93-53 TaxID=1314785 RepID=A0A165B6U8_9APHY|nr:uncharacterized protein LAESUDRAFT_732313 [Laetiporus sulphureus 93-53]KZT00377.1 hypothetical protein LAESUDRAFT_732313 [Laetiporus sulphureus 93-53]